MSAPTLAYLRVLRDDAAKHDVGFVRQSLLALLDCEIARRDLEERPNGDPLRIIYASVKAENDDLRAKLAAAEKERDQLREALRVERERVYNDAIRIAAGCEDYGGGYRGDDGKLDAFHHGMRTVAACLERARDNSGGLQLAVVRQVGDDSRRAAEEAKP